MAFRKLMKCEPSEILAAKGLLYHDWEALTPCQRECTSRLGMTIQMEQEAYLTAHPEIAAILKIFISDMSHIMKKKSSILKEAAQFFIRPPDVIDEEIRQLLGLPAEGPYIREDKVAFKYQDNDLERDLRDIISKHHPPEPWRIPTPDVTTPDTLSSSFISLITSDTTLPTPEPVPTPEPTLSEVMFALVSNTVDKAIYTHVNDEMLRYDTAYVELSKCVEEAMEVPVIQIREDLHRLFFEAFQMFEMNIMEKERVAAEIAWEKRMRKKMKRTLRRANNYKGYETPLTPKSSISSHESYRRPPPRPCKCHPQWHYNRYGKDRFGIYLPREEEFKNTNITVTPAISLDDISQEAEIDQDTQSVYSKKSTVSGRTKTKTDDDTKSVVSRKSAASGKSTATNK